jgi:hypothetical protein
VAAPATSEKNILPLAFRTIANQTDAIFNLLLDTITRAHLGRSPFGREGAIVQRGLNRQLLEDEQEATFRPILEMLMQGERAEEIMEQLRTAMPLLGGPKPNRLSKDKQAKRLPAQLIVVVELRKARSRGGVLSPEGIAPVTH